ncbi:MAG: hypothetical protein KatS3mg121_1127 [Gammaproteobacteria bacterium]|nr:MAG: hypothetical protein KatS3mg121_1127 [Gammaproteobacteria bacterium]
MFVFNLPDLGEGLPDAEIVRWFVKEGDFVEADQPLVEMETAKAVVEVPAPQAGRVLKLHGAPGDIIETGKPLVTLGEAEEYRPEAAEDAPPAEPAPEAPAPAATVKASAAVRALARKLGVALDTIEGTGPDGAVTLADVRRAARLAERAARPRAAASGRVPAAPKVRAWAAEAGVDLDAVDPSGHRGNVTLTDVKSKWKPGADSEAYRYPERTQAVTGQAQPVRGERRAMALGMARARDLIVNTTVTDRAFIDHWPAGTDITVRIIRAVIAACMVEPALNAWFDGERMERTLHADVNLGLAVDSPHGLSVPVIHAAQTLDPAALRARIDHLRRAVHEKSIKPEELRGATITLSNFGMIAGLYATPIVTPPQVAIVATGRIDRTLRLTEQGIVNARYLPISLSFDHRAVTGGDAVRFLAAMVADLSLAA